MKAPPCPLCGYARPSLSRPCPICGGAPHHHLARPLAGPLAGVGVALVALPRGFMLLWSTPRAKRWLLPPLILTAACVVALFGWARFWVAELAQRIDPHSIELPEGRWLRDLPRGFLWLAATWHGLATGIEWLLGGLVAFLLGQPFQFLTVFLIGSLVAWYGASILFEALAGPFLDEIQARVERVWFGEDPRSRLERPAGLPAEETVQGLCALGAGATALLLLALAWGTALAWPWIVLLSPLGMIVPLLVNRRFGPWLFWFLKVEARAFRAGILGALLSGGILVVALPLYFVPVIGYFLYAIATGIATATSLLDIPLERRDWPMAARLCLLRRHVGAWITFGILAGLMLSMPLIGPLLFVPVTSLGGLWLLCRLDKAGLAEGCASTEVARDRSDP